MESISSSQNVCCPNGCKCTVCICNTNCSCSKPLNVKINISCCQNGCTCSDCKCGLQCSCGGQAEQLQKCCPNGCQCSPCNCGSQCSKGQGEPVQFTGKCCPNGCQCADCNCGAQCSGYKKQKLSQCCPNGCTCTGVCNCGPNCCPLVAKVQKRAPHFEAMSYHNGFKKIKLSDYAGKYVVLFFYPLDFTFVCPTEIVQFSDRAKEFREVGCEVLGCSIDSQFCHMEYTKKDRKKGGLGQMDIPLISDVTREIARRYGCLIEDGDDAGLALRATYIIDKNQIVRHISINDLPVGRSVDETLRLVKAFQYTDEYGEVCPSTWKPGARTMKAEVDSEMTEKYWEEEHGKNQ